MEMASVEGRISWSPNHHHLVSDSGEEYAVVTVNAAKSFGQRNVFENVNMNVKRGNIYALLGPSGCGKTILLRCLLGRLKLDDGTVLLFGQSPGTICSGIPGPHVGYMPQETAIHLTLTIFECWKYYGGLLGVMKDDICAASSKFIELLHLPSGNTLNGNLSGGQLRRVAFATALIHCPKLLILDEPTVGIDPITKNRMWQHLEYLTSENGTTIILTTHYIDEACSANQVAMMHNHTLAVESNTSALLEMFNCKSLENVFLTICSGEKLDQKSNVIDARVEKVSIQSVATSSQWAVEFYVRWHILQALVVKNFINLYRFKGALTTCLFPCLQVVIFVMAIGESFDGVQLAVVNGDSGPLGVQFLSLLNQSFIHLKPFELSDNPPTGRHVSGLLTIPENFTEAMLQRIASFPLSSKESVLGGIVKVSLSDSDPQISHSVSSHLLDIFHHFQCSFYNSSGMNSAYCNPVISIGPNVGEQLMYMSSLPFLVLGMSIAAYFIVSVSAILHLYPERRGGYLECTRVAGVSFTEILLGMIIVLLVISFVQVLLLTIVSSVMFKNVNDQHWLLISVLLYWHGITGMSFGFFLSALITDFVVLIIAMGNIVMIAPIITGYFWTIQALPYFFRGVIRAFPHFYTTDAITILLYSGQKDYGQAVALAFVVNLIWIIIYLGATLGLLITTK